MQLETMLYEVDGAIATLTFNRPDRLNTIVPPMPEELERCVAEANRDRAVKVIVLRGAGRAFCAGFDFSDNVSAWTGTLGDRRALGPGPRPDRRHEPVHGSGAEVHEPVAQPEAGDRTGTRLVRGRRIGPRAVCRSRDRLGGRADRHALRARMGLLFVRSVDLPPRPHEGQGARTDGKAPVGQGSRRGRADQPRRAVRRARGHRARAGRGSGAAPAPPARRDEADRQPGVRQHGPRSTQLLGPILDGYMRNIAEAHEFIDVAAKEGVGEAVRRRDAPFGDYSQAPAERKPRPEHVIRPRRK